MANIPQNYRRLEGSERLAAPSAKLLGPADKDESFKVTIVVRRRPDGPPLPDTDAFLAPRNPMSHDEFVAKYGADPKDIAKVVDFAEDEGLTVVDTDPAQRTVVVTGTVERMSRAFAVSL